MVGWTPSFPREPGPRYKAIADAIARDLAAGVLAPGARLPTHRRLARELGVTVGTVSRGYAEAERRGLVVGEVGRGTFVRGFEPTAGAGWGERPEGQRPFVDMSLSLPVELEDGEEATALSRTLEEIAGGDPGRLLRYDPASAGTRQRAAAARWIARTGLEAHPDRLVVTAGAQHGLTVVLSTLLRPGDRVLTAELTYPGIKSLARMLGLRLEGLAMDEEGILPSSLARACSGDSAPAALYLVPTIQNPTCGILSDARRREIARIAVAHDLLVVEDDVHAFLPPDPPAPLATHAPRHTVYLASVAKALTTGLRTGFIVAPEGATERLLSGVRATMWMPAPLMTEITVRWLSDGTADRILARKRAEIEARQALASAIFRGHRIQSHPNAYHLWLHLPEPWRSDELVQRARQRGVLVAGAEAFAVGRGDVPHAVRVSLGLAPSRSELARGLEAVADVLAGTGEPGVVIV